ncbi:S-adenosyl-L-methionine-dependent methyltransferase [Fimicolochytrium jonesii]|uniref:S-adenosyl-L-methionine-dependent methyltransferase n=1 Tax=Fimicolochytrium jonesii TaxID=1396493 RepID=UPI0022FE2ADD|nr:S-adenosyl-L-methionine-dependent methyltransferase [Fimicolochytrium jonesii]KAI8817018.1 S-adenosyl-L-methionine-dependent methyltransferase [Fimicolochytrium jonesii]
MPSKSSTAIAAMEFTTGRVAVGVLEQAHLINSTLPPTVRFLDVASGGGVVTSKFISLNGAHGLENCDWHAKCLDYDDKMTETALAKPELQAGNVEIKKGDIQTLPYSDGEFTHAVWNFGPQTIKGDSIKAFTEIHRTLQSGGTLAFSVWTKPGWQTSIESIKPDFQKPPPLHAWTDPTEIHTKLENIGFHSVQIVAFQFDTEEKDADEYLENLFFLLPMSAEFKQEYSDHVREVVRREGNWKLTWKANIVVAIKA